MTAETELLDDLTDLFSRVSGGGMLGTSTAESLALEVVNLIGNRVRPPDELDALGEKLQLLGETIDAAHVALNEVGDILPEGTFT